MSSGAGEAGMASPTLEEPREAASPPQSPDTLARHDRGHHTGSDGGQVGWAAQVSPEAVPGRPRSRARSRPSANGSTQVPEDSKSNAAYRECKLCHPEFAAHVGDTSHVCPARVVKVGKARPQSAGQVQRKQKACWTCLEPLPASTPIKNALRARCKDDSPFTMLLCNVCEELCKRQDASKPVIQFEGEDTQYLACWHNRHCVPMAQFGSCTELMCTDCKASKHKPVQIAYTPSQIEQCERQVLGSLVWTVPKHLREHLTAGPRIWFKTHETLVLTWTAQPERSASLDLGAATGEKFFAHLKNQPIGQSTLADVWDVHPATEIPHQNNYVLGHVEFRRQAEPGEAAARNARFVAKRPAAGAPAAGATTPCKSTKTPNAASSTASAKGRKKMRCETPPQAVAPEKERTRVWSDSAVDRLVVDATSSALPSLPATVSQADWDRNPGSENEDSDSAIDDFCGSLD